jgi:hypothetical protein
MNTKVSLLAFVCLAGCTQMPPPAAVVAPEPPPLSPPGFFFQAPEPAEPPFARLCQLGTSCMAMDSRPFEVCLVGMGARSCGDKLAEPLLVDRAKVIAKPAPSR